MAADTPQGSRYALSFTSGALLLREAQIAAPIYLREQDWRKVRELIERGNLLQSRTRSTGYRLARELVQRLAELTNEEIELLSDATANERGHLMWAAACRRYELVGEFAEEVVRERFLLLNPCLAPVDFDSFVHSKAIWHPELEALTESTLRKLRTNMFLMLREAGLVSASGDILPCLLSPRIADSLRKRSPSDIRYFPATGG